MEAALAACLNSLQADQSRMTQLRNRLFVLLTERCHVMQLNGPSLDRECADWRLAGNLNCCFYPFEGQSLMLAMPELAVSSGSACTSAHPSPSHVLLALGLSEEEARSSLRFGIGRFNTLSEIEQTADWLGNAMQQLRKLT
jgi:cysteine desulfurase